MELMQISNEEHDKLRQKYSDLIGQRFSRLVITDIAGRNTKKKICVSVHCDCGNDKIIDKNSLKHGVTSCGCYHKEMNHKIGFQDLTGKRFGNLVVQGLEGMYNHYNKWYCLCDCGETNIVRGSYLKSGRRTKCKKCTKSKNVQKPEDLSGLKFGYLTPLSLVDGKDRAYWLCRCDCGNTTIVRASHLKYGQIISCGCIVSIGENIIERYLKNHHVQYVKQKTFIGCKYKSLLRFDFWLPEYGICVEFDGFQHYKVAKQWNDTEEDFEIRQRRDEVKTNYCNDNDIILLRIPHWEKDNIESILSDWLFLNDAEEANSSGVDLSA